jgi:hypothetical protein
VASILLLIVATPFTTTIIVLINFVRRSAAMSKKMETAIVRIFEQHLDFLSPDVATQLAKRFMAQFEDIYTRQSLEDVPAEELGKAHRFLVDELKQLVRGDPRLDLRYPDEAIVNVALLLVDDLVRVASPDRTMP